LRRLQVWLPATSDSTRVTCLTFWCPRLDAAVRWDFLIGWPREKTAVFYADEPSPHIRHGTVPLKLRSGWTVGTYVVMNTDEALGCAVRRCDVLSQLTKMVTETVMNVFAVFEARGLPRLHFYP
jgi:hypothetical protein